MTTNKTTPQGCPLALVPIGRRFVLMVALALVTGACSSSAFESQPVDSPSTTAAGESDHGGGRPTDSSDSTETLVIVDVPFEEPDDETSQTGEEISEEQAKEPTDEPVNADPDESDVVAQAGLGPGESALCATIQIGRDAVGDGASDVAAAQRRLLIDRLALAADEELASIVATIGDSQVLDAAVLDKAVGRCQDLGFEL